MVTSQAVPVPMTVVPMPTPSSSTAVLAMMSSSCRIGELRAEREQIALKCDELGVERRIERRRRGRSRARR